jgi:hypothetical protein
MLSNWKNIIIGCRNGIIDTLMIILKRLFLINDDVSISDHEDNSN